MRKLHERRENPILRLIPSLEYWIQQFVINTYVLNNNYIL